MKAETIETKSLETGLPLDSEGREVDYIGEVSVTIPIGHGKANRGMLADVIWQGCKAMVKESADPSTSEGRKLYLLSRARTNLFYHYLVLGCTEEEARAAAKGAWESFLRTCQNLGTAVKAQRLLKKREQEYFRLKRLYMDEVIEHKKTERRLEIEKEQTAFFHSCREFLYLALLEAKELSKDEIQGKLKEYSNFKNVAYTDFLSKKEILNRVAASFCGKQVVTFAGKNEINQLKKELLKEKAISCYLHDSKEAVIIELSRAENDSTITRHIKEKLRAFEAYALNRMEAKIKAIQTNG